MIPKKDMEGGIYYKGICRNAYVAEWDGKKEEFVYMRYKFGFMKDTIEHFEDVKDSGFDGFIPIERIERIPPKEMWKIKEELGY